VRASEDRQTLAFYEAEAPVYATSGTQGASGHLHAFLEALPAGARILELGCGSGRDAEAMISAGFDVDATDGSPALAVEAEKRLGRPVRVLRFSQIVAVSEYRGVWANACLLHVPRQGLGAVLARIHRALVPGGLFGAGYKAGTKEGRDCFGRYFNYPDEQWVRASYGQAADWAELTVERRVGSGYDGVVTDWLDVAAVG
jgi:SAM-dependent methyltransferase